MVEKVSPNSENFDVEVVEPWKNLCYLNILKAILTTQLDFTGQSLNFLCKFTLKNNVIFLNANAM